MSDLDPSPFDPFGWHPGKPFRLPPTFPEPQTQPAQDSLDLGALHGEALDALASIADENGGGVLGAFRGLVRVAHDRGLVTDSDVPGLNALADAFAEADADSFEAVHAATSTLLGSETSSPFAHGTASVAASNAGRAETLNTPKEGSWYAAGAADALGGAYGYLVFGIPGMLGGGGAASYVAHEIVAAAAR